MQSSLVATSDSKTWSQETNQNAKTCFLEDLEEMPDKIKESLSPKSRCEYNDNEGKSVTQNNATMTEGQISRSNFSASTPNIYSSSSTSAAKRDLRFIPNGEKNIDAHSFIMDSAAMDVRNVGGAAKFTTGKDSSEFRVFSSLKSRGTENIFSHSIGTLNSLSNYPPSLSRKIHTSSSNSMSSLDAVTSSKALLRDDSKTHNDLKGERNSAPERNSSFNNGGATKQIVAIASPAAAAAIDASSSHAEQRSLANDSFTTAASTLSIGDFCKICHCGSEINQPLIAPCFCSGSLKFVHQECLQKWIKSSDIKRCELCKYPFDMQAKVKPFCQWEKLDMSSLEKRKLFCSVTFHMVAITCVVWSLYVLIDRTAEEVRQGDLAWPFWTKLVVVAIGFTGGLVFMYIQCKVYVHLCRKWKAYNRIIVVQDAPEGIHKAKLDDNDAKDKDASALVSYSSSNSNNNDLHSGSIHIEDSRRNSNIVGSGASSSHPAPMEIESRVLDDSSKQPHFNDQESPIDCDDGELASSSNITRTTTIATVNSSLPSGSSNDNNLPSKSTKTNAETQTALRGVSLMEMIQRSSTTGTVDDIESGKCRNSKCSSQVSSGTNQVKVVTVSNLLDEMQTHSLNDVSVGNNDNGNMVQGAAIFFTECECKKKQSSNEVKDPSVENNSTSKESAASKEEQTFKLPGSPVEDLMDSVVKTENTLPINVSNTIVSPLTQKRGSK